MNHNDLPYQIALSQVPQVGPVHARILALAFPDAKAIFDAPKKQLEKLEGIGSVRANSIKQFSDFSANDNVMAWHEKHHIKPIFITSPQYPKRLLHCMDAPVLLFVNGDADLNANKVLSVVGTRNPSAYGREQCARFIAALPPDVLVISGLASGIDTIAHTEALQYGLQTVGIMAHGHDRIYPIENRKLALSMIQKGALATEFLIGTAPDRENFPKRNRIVAGMCDALLVIETGETGGSMITADLANDYSRDVFALPGRSIDPRSEGCNMLIRTNRAALVSQPEHLIQNMQWADTPPKPAVIQPQLFVNLLPEEELVADMLKKGDMHIDQLQIRGITPGKMAGILLQLELKGCVEALPGKMYRWK